ncbi:MAG: NupC/NupG family nucleoside CNT transporter [Deltaproteobacteria bacterium]|nr:MAG: NupC/NupG family nucleoside CNT transporter [Deltaproteobacteria bacterium]
MEKLASLFGLAGLVLFAWAISVDRKSVRWRPVLWGVGLQLAFAAAVLLPDIGRDVFDAVDVAVKRLVSFSEMGSDFVFQSVQKHDITVYTQAGQPTLLTVEGHISPPLKTLAFWVLPTVMFFSALMAVLYHYGVMQRIVRVFAVIMQKSLGTSGAESLSAAANIFVGQTEAPLIVRPFVDKMTMSELHAVMVGGFATVAGGVMAIYVAIVPIPGIAGHLVTASILSAPAALAVAKLMYPETGQPATLGRVHIDIERIDVNGIDALSRGTLEGLRLFLNIVAMLLVFYAMVMMINAILGGIGDLVGVELSLEIILGYLFAPFALLMGIPWDEALTAGMLLGKKITLTELFAYIDFGQLQASANALSERSAIIMSYALCGFANFASIGIQIGGIGGIAPERRGDLARLGVRAMIGGTLAAMMTGAVAGLFT